MSGSDAGPSSTTLEQPNRPALDPLRTGSQQQTGSEPEHCLDVVQVLIKPHLRGWLHTATFPISLVLGVILVACAPDGRTRLYSAVFAISASLLFGVSAMFHRVPWSPRASGVVQRMDHASIFLIIAGTYTPFSMFLLSPSSARTLMWIVWSGALAGVAFRVLWVGAPRWLYVPINLILGWVALAFLPQFLSGGGVAIFVLILAGGGLYTAGAVVYGLRRPNPSPKWFGFHEVFHVLTILAFLAHYLGVFLAAHSTRR